MNTYIIILFHIILYGTIGTTRNNNGAYFSGIDAWPYSVERANNKVTVKVYYESLCPGSALFFVEQLGPAVERLGEYMDIHMVPYGFARMIPKYHGRVVSFECHHGPEECYENRVHACAIDLLGNSNQAALFNACLMQYSSTALRYGLRFKAVVDFCSRKLHLAITDKIWSCVHGIRSYKLLKQFGIESQAMRLPYVPFVKLTGPRSSPGDGTIHLTATICRMLNPAPANCQIWDRYTQSN